MDSREREMVKSEKTYSSLTSFFEEVIDNINGDISFALYRLPGNGQQFNFVGTTSQLVDPGETALEEMSQGFIIGDFIGNTHFLKGEFFWESKTGTVSGYLPQLNISDKKEPSKRFHFSRQPTNSTSSNNYENLVAKSVDYIQTGQVFKLVPARMKNLPIRVEKDILLYFERLCEAYPNAFVSLISSTVTGTWMGASPELLVSTGNNEFKTVAVAGTQPYTNQVLSQVAWTQKEIEEQALVSRYIINCFKKIRLRDFEEYGPKTVIAGNLLHLKTEFKVNLKETGFPELGSVMLKLLHPTSAVCGMPLEEAKKFLLENEKFDRRYFSGFLGPVNEKDKTSVFVNIRCMEIHQDSVTLFAGAGVTADSLPEKELAETQHKFATIENIISSR